MPPPLIQLSVRSGKGLRLPPLLPTELSALRELQGRMEGEVLWDSSTRALYASDASIYEILPLAVAMPRSGADLRLLVEVASASGISLTPRAAGTSLAGQTTGPGIVVDTGRHMNRVLEVDPEGRRARVEPGVIRDDLNRLLRPHHLHFAPDTSTSNRCMIGGMIGNNSCGSHSVRYGTTRDHVEALEIVLSDGSAAAVGGEEGWPALRQRGDRLGGAVRALEALVRRERDGILGRWPGPGVRRRNTGYPLDELALSSLATLGGPPPDLVRFLCGTEGTLALTSTASLRLTPLPRHTGVVAAHFRFLPEAFHAAVEAVRWDPLAVELLDRRILELAALNPEQNRHRWFLDGDPAALLVIQMDGEDTASLKERLDGVAAALRQAGLGYAHPLILPPRDRDVWELRKAGLGVLMAAPGDVKPATLVEDTAVAVEDLPAYMEAFGEIMERHQVGCVYYAHASVGEIHLRPELDLKSPLDADKAEAIAGEVADLVARFRGALSGEHGDGRLRAPFLERVLGPEGVGWLQEVKEAFDPGGTLNPGVIVRPAPFREGWRYAPGYAEVDPPTVLAFADAGGLQRMVERCNGAGVCRRLAGSGGTMCPSYMATRNERDSTRGRANLLRRALQDGLDGFHDSSEVEEALELCLSCKGCRSECPASVDMARLKAEWQQGRWDRTGVPLGARMVAELPRLGALARRFPGGVAAGNALLGLPWGRAWVGRLAGFAPGRRLPRFASRGAMQLWARRGSTSLSKPLGWVLLFADELTDLYQPELLVKAGELLEAGGGGVRMAAAAPSGRTHISKGLLRDAHRHILRNLELFRRALAEGAEAIVGVEPSALLTFRDEAVDMAPDEAERSARREVASRVLLVEEFLLSRVEEGRWRAAWRRDGRGLAVHGHCHQKALAGTEPLAGALALPPGHRVRVLPSGCCGMAGSFGYEHPELSMAIGELVLFPEVRRMAADEVLVAPGLSCRHQVEDGTGKQALHPVEVLHSALER